MKKPKMWWLFHSFYLDLCIPDIVLTTRVLLKNIGNMIKRIHSNTVIVWLLTNRIGPLEGRIWLKNLYLISRVLVIIAIIGMIITSFVVIITAFAEFFRIISFFMHEGILSEEAAKFLSVNVTEMIDLYLIGLVLIIMSLGLYQLFIDSEVDLPEWLDTPSFDVLKIRLLIVVAVVLPVMFLGLCCHRHRWNLHRRTGNRHFTRHDSNRLYPEYCFQRPD